MISPLAVRQVPPRALGIWLPRGDLEGYCWVPSEGLVSIKCKTTTGQLGKASIRAIHNSKKNKATAVSKLKYLKVSKPVLTILAWTPPST